jgi:two-component system, chemotaxis family, sensor kinase CheA
MALGALPEGIISRFRTLSLERIGRVESVWNALLQGAEDEEAVRTISRDLHTLKGDAKVVGFDEVHELAKKLEELLALAGQFQYRVSEDFELVVTMATQFVSMLLKKKSAATSGIDLEGFVRQVDDVLRETLVLRKTRPTNPRVSILAAESAADRLSPETRRRLAAAATDAFLEYLGARNAGSRVRLRRIWQTLSQELSRLHAIELAPLLERQRAAGEALADELGKQIDLVIDANDTRVEPRVAEAVDMAVLHLVRNAIDHGIELPSARAAAGKSRRGKLAIHADEVAGNVQVRVEDDGCGVDVEALRAAAVSRGLIDGSRATSEREVLDVLFHPGFSTRADVSDVSGRGVGLDAVKSGIVKVGGSVRFANRHRMGATVTIIVPAPVRQLRVFQFFAPGSAVNLAVSARWTPTVEPLGADAIDPIQAMQLVGGSRQTLAGAPAPKQLAVRLRWGFLEIPIRAATEPVLATAERVCPTPDDHPVEVLEIDGVEALLLRPEHVAELAARSRR